MSNDDVGLESTCPELQSPSPGARRGARGARCGVQPRCPRGGPQASPQGLRSRFPTVLAFAVRFWFPIRLEQITPTASNLRGRSFRVYDGAGLLEQEAFDVDGNLVRRSRRLAAAYAMTPDWAVLDDLTAPADMDAATAALLEAEDLTIEGGETHAGRRSGFEAEAAH